MSQDLLDLAHAAACEDSARNRYLSRVDSIVVSLRQIADEVERHGPPSEKFGTASIYGSSAHDILHDVLWGVANLNMDALVAAAAEADVFHGAQKEFIGE